MTTSKRLPYLALRRAGPVSLGSRRRLRAERLRATRLVVQGHRTAGGSEAVSHLLTDCPLKESNQ
jgi:hypothetical protein